MKNLNRKILISIFIFLIVLLSISIIIANNTSSKISSEDKEKIYYQLRYLDEKTINMNNLAVMTSNNNSDNWLELQRMIQILYNDWNSIILDFNSLEIDKGALTDFGKILDNLSISIKNQNKQGTLENLNNLYAKITIYAESLNFDENYTNLVYTKYHLLIANSIVEKGNWTIVHEDILKADNYLSNVVNSMQHNQYSQYNVNQAYIAVKEMENLINIKDVDVFYLKYNIAMEKLNKLSFDF